MEGRIYQLAYRFSRHYLFGWPISRWLVFFLLVLPLLFLPSLRLLPAVSWPLLIVLVLVSLSGLVSLWRISRQGYLRFLPDPEPPDVEPDPLSFPEKVPVYGSGYFAVNGKTRYFVAGSAHYQAFYTRERVIMMQIERTRLLLLAGSHPGESGFWYIFFTNDILHSFESGKLYFGKGSKPAIRFSYQPDENDKPATFYLSFDDQATRDRILADLQAG